MPAHRPYPYVAYGATLIKVGVTSNPDTRYAGLRQLFRSKGDRIIGFAHFGPADHACHIEDALIRFCRERFEQHSGFEWFVGADHEAVSAFAVAEVGRVDRFPEFPPPTPEQIRAWQIRDWREQQSRARRLARYDAAGRAEHRAPRPSRTHFPQPEPAIARPAVARSRIHPPSVAPP
jgi:hypothetical protein